MIGGGPAGIAASWSAAKHGAKVLLIERYGFFIVMGLVLMGVINSLWMGPIMATTFEGIQWVLQPLASLLQLAP